MLMVSTVLLNLLSTTYFRMMGDCMTTPTFLTGIPNHNIICVALLQNCNNSIRFFLLSFSRIDTLS